MKSIRFHNSSQQLTVGKILCLGRNYAEHAKEMMAEIPREPVIFLKPSTAIIGNGENIVIPSISHEMHHEVELVVAIGKEGKHISPAQSMQHIAGYAVGLDMTLRDIQSAAKKNGLPWAVAKGFDTSAPVSEFIPAASATDPKAFTIRCSVNGTKKQESSTGDMIFPLEQIISYLSTIFTLEAGDLIYTGTPDGVGPVKAGDIIEAELAGFAKITHQVVHA